MSGPTIAAVRSEKRSTRRPNGMATPAPARGTEPTRRRRRRRRRRRPRRSSLPRAAVRRRRRARPPSGRAPPPARRRPHPRRRARARRRVHAARRVADVEIDLEVEEEERRARAERDEGDADEGSVGGAARRRRLGVASEGEPEGRRRVEGERSAEVVVDGAVGAAMGGARGGERVGGVGEPAGGGEAEDRRRVGLVARRAVWVKRQPIRAVEARLTVARRRRPRVERRVRVVFVEEVATRRAVAHLVREGYAVVVHERARAGGRGAGAEPRAFDE